MLYFLRKGEEMLTPLNQLGFELHKVNRLHRICVNTEAEEMGLFLGQHHILAYILHNPGCSQKEIAGALRQSPASITLSSKRLEEQGLIEKEIRSSNLRVNHLVVTPKGKENCEKFKEILDKYDAKMFEGFSEDELAQLDSFIKRMEDNLGKTKPDNSENND